MVGDPSRIRAPFLIDWSRDKFENIIDSKGNTLFYKANNLVDENYNVSIPSSNFEYINGDLELSYKPLTANGDYLHIGDVYTINSQNNLVTHEIGPVLIPSNQYTKGEDGKVRISSEFLQEQAVEYFNH